METLIEEVAYIYSRFGAAIFVPIVIFMILAFGAQYLLYEKCGLKGLACIVPVWNVIEFLKIMGRPAWHSLFVIIPPLFFIGLPLFGGDSLLETVVTFLFFVAWLGFMIKVYIELCNCFGKFKMSDYILVIIFNGLYVLSLGLSYEDKYRGPVYNKEKTDDKQLA
jgi:hypothetical protein